MPTQSEYDVAIIGGGLAGITAALELFDEGLKVVIIDRDNAETNNQKQSRTAKKQSKNNQENNQGQPHQQKNNQGQPHQQSEQSRTIKDSHII